MLQLKWQGLLLLIFHSAEKVKKNCFHQDFFIFSLILFQTYAGLAFSMTNPPHMLNPVALGVAHSFGPSECNKVKDMAGVFIFTFQDSGAWSNKTSVLGAYVCLSI